ncbi:hypothetical protein DPQ33_02935 [Oceanidesulfovibrio indonesiensis]|uniref:Uncharacterized protein n=1 Tax=Oceanidesulfovibrio indonesiensis TaxID=54767 RepID=A0A7M3MIV4_9BACT|nr:hypothetical protein [Oceanidesulfovibrio indonesiensis]TVM19330.1 hypothetical protein DPQ33_02935 [Oceanidesulfovibrio indonesiensis]
MGIFKEEKDFKRVIFNVDSVLAERLESAKERSRNMGRKLDVDTAVDKALEKFLKKAEKKLDELEEEQEKKKAKRTKISGGAAAPSQDDSELEGEGQPADAERPVW